MTLEQNPPRLNVTNAVMTAARTLTDLFPKPIQVTLNRADVSRGAEYWLIVTPGGFTPARLDAHDNLITWRLRLELAVSFAEYSTRTEKFIIAAEALRTCLQTPHALKNIRISPPVIVTGEDLTQDIPGASPNWIVQPLIVTVTTFVPNA